MVLDVASRGLILEHFILKEQCEETYQISGYLQKYIIERDLVALETSSNLHGAVKESSLHDKELIEYLDQNLKPHVERFISSYLSFNPLLMVENYYLKHYSIMHQKENFNIPFHYDSEYVYEKEGDENIRNFAVLMYLNDDFESGDLIFPVQKISIKPRQGLLVIFPTSFMFPHTTMPSSGGDRFVLRLNYLFKKEGIKKSVKNTTVY